MAFRFVRGSGVNTDAAVVNLAASGVVRPGNLVDYVRGGTGGAVVYPTGSASTTTMVFGLCAQYAQGASDTFVDVTPLGRTILLEADCANAASTAQVGLRHALSASDRGVLHNTASDVSGQTGIFTAIAMTGLTTGSGKLIGYVNVDHGILPVNSTTWVQ